MAVKEDGSGRPLMLQPEQKTFSRMKDMVEPFSRDEDLSMHTSVGTIGTAKACMLLPRHQRFVGCDVVSFFFERAFPDVISTFPKQVFNEKTDTTRLEEVQSAGRVFASVLEQLVVNRSHYDWAVPRGIVPVQMFPQYIIAFL